MESKSFCLSAAHLTMRFHVCFFVFVGVNGCFLFNRTTHVLFLTSLRVFGWYIKATIAVFLLKRPFQEETSNSQGCFNEQFDQMFFFPVLFLCQKDDTSNCQLLDDFHMSFVWGEFVFCFLFSYQCWDCRILLAMCHPGYHTMVSQFCLGL